MSGFVLADSDSSGAIVSGIPLLRPPKLPGQARRLVSLPFTDALDPLVDPSGALAFVELLGEARQELGMARLELRGELAGADPGPPAAVIHTLPIEADAESVAKGFANEKRRNVRVAIRKGLEVRHAENERDLTETFFELHVDTRRRLGVPTQPKRFFHLLWQRIIEPGSGFVLMVREGGTPVAGAVFLTGNGRVVYKYSASDFSRRNLKPNDLLIWSAIEHACNTGFTTFDFGRTDLHAEGLRTFKSSWGATESPLVYSTIGGNLPAADDGSHTSGMMKQVLQRSPAWVTRTAGELLYRYAA